MTPERLQEIRLDRDIAAARIAHDMGNGVDHSLVDLLAAYDALQADYAAAVRALCAEPSDLSALSTREAIRSEMLVSSINDLAAAQARIVELEAVLAYIPEMLRGLGEHGVTIVLESEEADGQAFAQDPGFVTRLKEVFRVWGEAAAQAAENKAALSASSPKDALWKMLNEAETRGVRIGASAARDLMQNLLRSPYVGAPDFVERCVDGVTPKQAQPAPSILGEVKP